MKLDYNVIGPEATARLTCHQLLKVDLNGDCIEKEGDDSDPCCSHGPGSPFGPYRRIVIHHEGTASSDRAKNSSKSTNYSALVLIVLHSRHRRVDYLA